MHPTSTPSGAESPARERRVRVARARLAATHAVPAGVGERATAPRWIAPALFLALTAVRLVLIRRLGLFNDEAYYWEWSRRLAASYYDHPPAVAWVLAASTRLLGWTELAVHLPALVFSLAASVVLHRFTLALFPGRRALAWSAVLLLNASPLFALGAVFTTPDAPCTFFWILTLYLVWRALHGSERSWYLAGLAAGLGLLSKYNLVLLPPAILVLLLRPRYRGWLRRKEPWLALAIMLLCFAPVVFWNLEHGWASFAFHLVERHHGAFRPWKTLLRFLAAQQAMSPLLWLACVAGMVRSGRLARAGSDAHAFLFWPAAVVLAFFGAVALFTYVNPNWFGMGLVTAIVSAADLLRGSRSRAVRIAPGALALALSLVFYVQARTLFLPLPPKADLATDLNGWDEVGERLRALEATLPRSERPFVFSSRLQLSAMAAFYGGPGLDVRRLGFPSDRRDQYDEWVRPGELQGRSAIYFTEDQKFRAPDGLPFRTCVPAGELPIVRAGRWHRTFTFWRCSGYGG